MKNFFLQLTGFVFSLFTTAALATTHYVDLNSTNATPPFTDWSIAATNIQDAVDAAVNGDLVLVTNGVYATGGRVVYGSLTNRVVIDKAITVSSVNGSEKTVISGNGPMGNNAVRCVYLANNAILIGFTVTNGSTRSSGDTVKEQSGGGVWCESTNSILDGCLIISNTAYITGGGSFRGTLTNCFVAGNATRIVTPGSGGGISGSEGLYNYSATNCIAINCVISNNSSVNGGGAYLCFLLNCTVIKNSAVYPTVDDGGGGAVDCALTDCLVAGNTGGLGGGLLGCFANNCTITNNLGEWGGGVWFGTCSNCWIANNLATNSQRISALGYGGGAYGGNFNRCVLSNNAAAIGNGIYSGTLNRCQLFGNGADSSSLNNCTIIWNALFGASSCVLNGCVLFGNGAISSALNNCTVTGNTTFPAATNCTLQNCILYYNLAGNYVKSTNRNCCTIPQPSGAQNGGGNFTNAPLFVDLLGSDFHLQSNSPCINAGNNSFVTNSTDLDGNPRIVGGTVDIGAYEYQSPSSVFSYAWAQQYGLPTDGSADFTDTDGDGLNNWQEWVAGTNPTNSASLLAMNSPATNSVGLKITWQSVSGKNYFLQRATNLFDSPAFSAIQSNIVGLAGTTSYSDATATNGGPYFYRVGVQ